MLFMKQQPCGKCANNGSESSKVGKPCQQHDKDKRDKEFRFHDIQFGEQANQQANDIWAKQQCAADEEGRKQDCMEDAVNFHAAGNHDSGNNREHHQSEHIIHHGCTENHMGLLGVFLVYILEYTGSDADAGGAKCGAQKHMHRMRSIGGKPPGHHETQGEWQQHPNQCNPYGVDADLFEFCYTGIQTHVEQQEYDPVTGEDIDSLGNG